jgi:hypothetical protein
MGPKGVPYTKTDRPTDRRSKHQLTNYITDFWNVKWLPQRNQLYSLSEIIIMLELETLPTDYTDLSENVNFFKYLKLKNIENLVLIYAL